MFENPLTYLFLLLAVFGFSLAAIRTWWNARRIRREGEDAQRRLHEILRRAREKYKSER